MGWVGRVALPLVVAGALTLWNCGASGPNVRDVSGAWSASYSGLHFDYVYLLVTQDGAVLGGKACRTDRRFLIFRDAQVVGAYPDLTFVVQGNNWAPCCATWQPIVFRGAFGSDDTLRGYFYEQGRLLDFELVFRRTTEDATCKDART